ncbi:hypothetical protein [Enterococcus faecalis]|uniref:hypothetical protein n=1 Tax=Enterococcus TaxID=1350 RepID=UPI000B3CB51B|nr:hypothetical protein [Enterococcus faecalis]ARV02500.1 hypothetical protein A6B47_00890 [Enterococcus faecalis]EGO8196764.1 hypothetical protein [Enterococcus faecalis]EGO8848079.1 hypothetical protein [Enterococcus faecalis]MBG9436549.1 hypothetical protein [Enterococcus faecalis]MBG9439321.1 hypothetical protein [Enterococcus faecalis]
MNQLEFNELLDKNPQFLKAYLQENLLTKDEAPKYTKQTQAGFDQSAKIGTTIQPFFSKQKNGRTTFKLYLKSEMIEYGKNKRNK